MPRSKGGSETVDCCSKCNATKASLSVEEFRAVMAARKGLLPNLRETFLFWFEEKGLGAARCKHNRLLLDTCFKCGNWQPGYLAKREFVNRQSAGRELGDGGGK